MNIPKGWRLVPVDPTDDMRDAGRKEYKDGGDYIDCYVKMLSAAPPAPQEAAEYKPAWNRCDHCGQTLAYCTCSPVKEPETATEIAGDFYPTTPSAPQEPISGETPETDAVVDNFVIFNNAETPRRSREYVLADFARSLERQRNELRDIGKEYDLAMIESNRAGFACVTAADTIRLLAEERNELKRQLEELRGRLEWISVKERLPEHMVTVLAVIAEIVPGEGAFVDTVSYHSDRNAWLYSLGSRDVEVTASFWQYLPPAPKGDEK